MMEATSERNDENQRRRHYEVRPDTFPVEKCDVINLLDQFPSIC